MQRNTLSNLTAEAMIAPDGSLVLLTPALLPFKPGQRLHLQISVCDEQETEAWRPCATPVMRFEEMISGAA